MGVASRGWQCALFLEGGEGRAARRQKTKRGAASDARLVMLVSVLLSRNLEHVTGSCVLAALPPRHPKELVG
jgi:hypothetical protein